MEGSRVILHPLGDQESVDRLYVGVPEGRLPTFCTTSSHVTELKLGFTVKYISETVARLHRCSLIHVLKGKKQEDFLNMNIFFSTPEETPKISQTALLFAIKPRGQTSTKYSTIFPFNKQLEGNHS